MNNEIQIPIGSDDDELTEMNVRQSFRQDVFQNLICVIQDQYVALKNNVIAIK